MNLQSCQFDNFHSMVITQLQIIINISQVLFYVSKMMYGKASCVVNFPLRGSKAIW